MADQSKLPKGWEWKRLREICEINPRDRLSPDLDDETPVTFVPMQAVSENGMIKAPEVRPLKAVKKGYTRFKDGDVLFAKITPCMENGKTAIARGLCNGLGFGSTEFHILRPRERVIADWVHLFIRQQSFRDEAKASMRGGVGQQRVPEDFLSEHEIPIPLRYGLTAKASPRIDGILFIRITDIDSDGKLRLTEPHFVQIDDATFTNLIRFCPDTKKVDPRFLFFFLQSSGYWAQLNQHKIGGAQPNVNAENLKRIRVPLPPMDEQRHIVAYLDGLQAKVEALRRLQAEPHAEIDALTSTMLDKAFQGKLLGGI